MNETQIAFITAGFLILLLFFLSIIESSVTRLSRLSLKVLAEREANPKTLLLGELSRDRYLFLLPLEFGIEVLQILIAVLVSTLFLLSGWSYAPLWSVLVLLVLVTLVRLLIPRLVAERNPQATLLKLLPLFRSGYRLLWRLSLPLLLVLRSAKALESTTSPSLKQDEEASEEEIQAYINVGEEEGIIEEEEGKLIQSALEFGSTLVRGIMTPRAETVAIEERATISELKKLMVSSNHSRIPVYRGQIDQIVGVVYVRHLLADLEEGKGQSSIKSLINEAWFVPETKRVSDLLKEMQKRAEHLAIVVNEYGTVSGLVTIEDLVEEIVGEIRDEDELDQVDVDYEGEGTYLVRGSTEITELEETFGIDLGKGDVTTVSGLVVTHLGQVPAPGETIRFNGIQAEVLNADRSKIHTMRIRKTGSAQLTPSHQSSKKSKQVFPPGTI